MAYIKEDFIARLEEQCDIVDVLSSYVQLKSDGSGRYECCCPFHNEKTPSFKVYVDSQSYHCFGCKKSGRVLRFLQDYEGIGFVEAVERLAGRYGITIEYEESKKGNTEEAYAQNETKDKGFEVLREAMIFFQKALKADNPAAQKARAYLANRGFSQQIIEDFHIGYAPANDLVIINLAKIFNEDLLEQVGLMKNTEYGKRPFFRDRIIFPILEAKKGRVVGFGARAMADEMPKYLNSAENEWFKKKYELYGLFNVIDTAKKRAKNLGEKRSEEVVVCEGYADVVQMHQQGFINAVASLGTAFGDTHLAQLTKYFKTINFCFDGDEAGRKAAVRTLRIVFENFDESKIYKFTFLKNRENPNEKEDPDSFLRKYGKEELAKELAAGFTPEAFLELILNIKDINKLSIAEKTQKIDKVAAEWLSYLKNDKAQVYRENLKRRLESLGVIFKNQVLNNYPKNNTSFTTNNKPQNNRQTEENREEIFIDNLEKTTLTTDEKAFELVRKIAKAKEKNILAYLIINPDYYTEFEEFKIYREYIAKYMPSLTEFLYLCDCGANRSFLMDFLNNKNPELVIRATKDKFFYSPYKEIKKEIKAIFEEIDSEERKLSEKVEKLK